jgi:ribose 5-phosphate isomerase A
MRINNIPGVLENGLFVGLADEVLVGEIHGDTTSVRRL